MNRLAAWLVLALLTTPIVTTPLSASPSSQTEILEERLAALDRDVAAVRDALDAPKNDLDGLRVQRDALAEAVVVLGLQSEEIRQERSRLARELRGLEANPHETFDAVETGRRAREILALHTRELPSFEARTPTPVTPAPDTRTPETRTPETQAPETEWIDLVSLFVDLHRAGTSVSVETTTIRDADGHEATLDLLHVGLIAFAYRKPSTPPTYGVAVSSPREARGYRFTERLDRETIAQLDAAFSKLAGGAKSVTVPIDPSATIAAGFDLIAPTWLDRLRSGGPLMIPLAVIALAVLTIAIERTIRLTRASPSNVDAVLARVLTYCQSGSYSEATAFVAPHGVPGRVLSAAIDKRNAGPAAVEDVIQEQLLHELPRLERFLGGLGVLAVVAPLIGLLGTVTGIIQTFGVIRELTTNDPQLLSGGISQALMTTAGGLAIAIPALLILGYLRGRVDRIVSDTERCAASLLIELGSPDSGGTPPRDDPTSTESSS